MGAGMDQISRPLLFLLIAVVGFAGAWMTVLRPQAESSPAGATPAPIAAPATTPATALGSAVDGAQGAAAASDASTAARERAAANPAGAPAPAAARTPAAKAKPESAAPAAKPAGRPKVTVLLFAGTGADDAVARDVVRSARRPGVRVVVASLRDVASYADLLGGVEVTASPTILVIGKNRRAQRIEGLPDAAQVQQALRAAR